MPHATGTFHVSFDTETYPGKLRAVQIVISNTIMGDEDVANLALCEHPLYPALVQYVMDNPARPPK